MLPAHIKLLLFGPFCLRRRCVPLYRVGSTLVVWWEWVWVMVHEEHM